jgi:DMSO/TMAO reductase YedYZ molybdopterin-dependent catalytic subunit
MPGSIGARNVKWVTKIRISDAETDACWNGVYYKHGDGAYVLEQGAWRGVPTMLTWHQRLILTAVYSPRQDVHRGDAADVAGPGAAARPVYSSRQ